MVTCSAHADYHSILWLKSNKAQLVVTQLERIHFGTILGPKWAEGPPYRSPSPNPFRTFAPLGFKDRVGKSSGLVADATLST